VNASLEARRHYRAYGNLHAAWPYRDDELLIAGPAGTGKSRFALERIHAACLRWPRARFLIARKTRESLTESALVTFETKVLPEGSPIAWGPSRRLRQLYRYPNGSEIVVGGLDKPSKIMSTEFDGAYVQEAIELNENDWESITTRLRNGVVPFQQLLADTNPDQPFHWLKVRCDRRDCRMVESRHEDNPVLWDQRAGRWTAAGLKYIAKLDRLTGARKERLRFGRWVQAEGVVYEEWDRALHLIDPFPIPPTWRRIRAIDFGYQNPFVCQWWAIDHDGRLYLYREIYMSHRTVRQHARQIKQIEQQAGEVIDDAIADHDAEDRATLREEGISTIAARKDIKMGINRVKDRLVRAGDGRPRIYIFRDALVERDPWLDEHKLPCCTAEEFDAYVWAPPTEGRAPKEVPLDKDNHGQDSMRYCVMAIDTGRVDYELHLTDAEIAAAQAQREIDKSAAIRENWDDIDFYDRFE
jgi:PBSX family phage terminase large subunit